MRVNYILPYSSFLRFATVPTPNDGTLLLKMQFYLINDELTIFLLHTRCTAKPVPTPSKRFGFCTNASLNQKGHFTGQCRFSVCANVMRVN